jgi:hypothetical protein
MAETVNALGNAARSVANAFEPTDVVRWGVVPGVIAGVAVAAGTFALTDGASVTNGATGESRPMRTIERSILVLVMGLVLGLAGGAGVFQLAALAKLKSLLRR